MYEKFIKVVRWVAGLTALSNSLLRRRFSFAELTFLFCGMTIARSGEGLVLALRAGGMVIWNAKRLGWPRWEWKS